MSQTSIVDKENNISKAEVNSFEELVQQHQPYLFFRNCFAKKKILDLNVLDGNGVDYASIFASQTVGLKPNQSDVQQLQHRYPNTKFARSISDIKSVHDFDLIVGLNLDNLAILSELEGYKGCLILSSKSNFNDLQNQVNQKFKEKEAKFLWQESEWPHLIKTDKPKKVLSMIAVIGDIEIPQWPSLGFAIPTHNGSQNLQDAFLSISGSYPGETYFSVTANACTVEETESLKNLEKRYSKSIHTTHSQENLGYGVGTNLAFQCLQDKIKPDYYLVSNDDVIASRDCLSLLVEAMKALESQGHKPGIIAPVSNAVSGVQLVQIGEFNSLETMQEKAEWWHRQHHENLFAHPQLRGLLMLIHPDCIKTIGGFDPLFGIGNFEDDDYCVRAKLAGFSLWIAQGAFLFHKGSQTFLRMKVDYKASIEKNGRIFNRKWRVENMIQAFDLATKPRHIDLNIDLSAKHNGSGHFMELNNDQVDLVHEATDYEFLGWMMFMLQKHSYIDRADIINTIEQQIQVA
jgi:GT2 family glycosyltransferase